MNKETIKKLLKEYKVTKEKSQLIKTLKLLDENRIFIENKGKDLIFELEKDKKIKSEE